MAQLIITEKDTAARRIAEIVSGKKYKTEKVYNLPLYTVEDGSTTYIFGLKGHLLKVDFPEDYKNWQEVNPRDLINARIIKTATKKNVLKALRKISKEADKLIIATDFDREGELIGVDAANEVKKVNPDIEITRAKFSALTEEEVNNALNKQELPCYNLAFAGEARQDIDLIWGATLTRFLSLASKRLGTRFLSVGRVQSPTLCLIALKEKEIKEFKPVQYWQIKVLLKDGESEFWAIHNRDRFLDNAEVKNIFEKLGKKGRVDKVESKKNKTPPPAPFNTTSFLAASSAIRITPSRAMFIAESLYMKGLISYPRVDNTVFPPSLKMESILEILKNQNEFGIYASELIAKKRFKPTRGKKHSTDHPPIHPTGLARKEDLKPHEWKIYELVSRRFFAILSDSAEVESSKVEIDIDKEIFIVKGSRVIYEGWMGPYPYSRKKDVEIPLLKEGERVEVIKKVMDEKETKPPPRYSQGKLIQEMEKLGLGTKATRHQIIQNLYDRSYIINNPAEPTELGAVVAEIFLNHIDLISSPKMTSELEEDMDEIAKGKKERKDVVEHSRNMLANIMNLLEVKKPEIEEEVKGGIKGDKVIGKCSKCGGELRIIRAKKSKKRFVGCKNYPECKNSFPLPQRGNVISLNSNCEKCGAPKVKILNKGKRPWHICLDISCKGEKN